MRPRQPGSVLMALAGGAVSVVCQSLLMRESLHARHLGELAAALSLAGWLLSSGAGAAASTLLRAGPGAWGLMLCLLPPVSLAGVAAARLAGASPAVASIPAGLLAGAVFVPPWRGGSRPSAVCTAEAAGALAGGAMFALASRHLLCASLSAYALCLAGAGVAAAGRRRAGAVAAAAALAVIATGLGGSVDSAMAGRGAHGFALVEVSSSRWGEVAVMERDGQRAFFRGGVLDAWDCAPEAAEQLALVPLALATPERVVYAGSSPDVAELAAAWPGVRSTAVISPEGSDWIGAGPATTVEHGDARTFISSLDGEADLIIVSSSMPLTLAANRLLTREFLGECRSALSPRGVLAFQLPLGENRLAPLQAGIAASVLGASPFRTSLVVPLGGALFLMGDSLPGPGSIGESVILPDGYEPVMLDRLSLSWHLSPGAVERYMQPVMEVMTQPNTDLDPVAFRMLMPGWGVYGGTASSAVHWALAAAGALALLSAVLLRRPAASALTLAPGIAGTGLEVLCLLVVQSVLGTAWVMVGAVTACFMGGFAAGSAAAGACRSGIRPAAVLAASALPPALATAAMLAYASGMLGGVPLAVTSLACTALSGAAAGAGFALAAGMAGEACVARTVGLCELGALAGSAAACVAVPMLLLPALGAPWTGAVLLAVVLAAVPAGTAGSPSGVRSLV